MSVPARIALLGAESTGKTTLARALASRLQDAGLRVVLVPEVLREFCDREGRLPGPEDQRGIAEEQARRVLDVADADIVIADWRGDTLPKEPNKLRPAVVIEDDSLFGPSYPNVILVPLTEDAGLAIPGLMEPIEPSAENGCSKCCYALAPFVASTLPRSLASPRTNSPVSGGRSPRRSGWCSEISLR